MNSPEDRSWVLEALRRARRPAEETTAETLEENLRWLIQVAHPEAAASEALRQRVHALALFRSARPRGRLRRAPAGARLRRRRSFRDNARAWEAPEGGLREREEDMLDLLLLADFRRLPDDVRLRREVHQWLQDFLARLPELEREALQLQMADNRSIPEIARIMDLPEAEVHQLLRQARSAFLRYRQNYLDE